MFEDVIVFYRHDRHEKVKLTQNVVNKEKQVVALVFKADTIINEGTVVLVGENTTVAYAAVAGPSRLDVITFEASFLNKVQILGCFMSILQKLLHLLRETFEPVVIVILKVFFN